jgi:hypothetical protein
LGVLHRQNSKFTDLHLNESKKKFLCIGVHMYVHGKRDNFATCARFHLVGYLANVWHCSSSALWVLKDKFSIGTELQRQTSLVDNGRFCCFDPVYRYVWFRNQFFTVAPTVNLRCFAKWSFVCAICPKARSRLHFRWKVGLFKKCTNILSQYTIDRFFIVWYLCRVVSR